MKRICAPAPQRGKGRATLLAGSGCDRIRKPKSQYEASSTCSTVGQCSTPDPTIAKVKPNRRRQAAPRLFEIVEGYIALATQS